MTFIMSQNSDGTYGVGDRCATEAFQCHLCSTYTVA